MKLAKTLTDTLEFPVPTKFLKCCIKNATSDNSCFQCHNGGFTMIKPTYCNNLSKVLPPLL